MADGGNESGSPGPATDRFNAPVIDPTKNVDALVEAAIKRQDDLRQMEAGYIARIGEMRENHARYITELRAQYGTELRLAETARIDAIRAVDVGAVNRAAEVSATQAATLATQVATSAEALRGQVEAARQQTATALAAALEPIQKDIQDLRRAQYEAQGQKTQVVESSTTDRDDILLRQAQIQAAAQRTQVYALIIAALVLAIGIYAAFHKLRSVDGLHDHDQEQQRQHQRDRDRRPAGRRARHHRARGRRAAQPPGRAQGRAGAPDHPHAGRHPQGSHGGHAPRPGQPGPGVSHQHCHRRRDRPGELVR